MAIAVKNAVANPVSGKKAAGRSGVLSRITAFKRNSSGNVVMIFGLAAIPLIGCVGLALDGSRVLLAKSELQAALDSAALAVGSTENDSVNLEQRLQEFTRTNYHAGGTTAPNVELPVSSGDTITATATTQLQTYFMGVLNIDTVDIEVNAEIQMSVSGLMVAMVLDNTGSMWGGNKIGALKSATQELVDILFAAPETGVAPASPPVGLRMSLVPYSAVVNVGEEAKTGSIFGPDAVADAKAAITGDPQLGKQPTEQRAIANGLSTAKLGAEGFGWRGCVRARTGGSIQDQPGNIYKHKKYASLADTTGAEDGYWKPFIYPNGVDNSYNPNDSSTVNNPYAKNSNNVRGPNVGCGNPIHPLTNDYTALSASVQHMTAWNRGGTISDIGMAWGIRTLSPDEPFTQSAQPSAPGFPAMASDPAWRKAIVIMTDGENNIYDWKTGEGLDSDDTAYGPLNTDAYKDHFGVTANMSNNTSKAQINERTLSMCDEQKRQGVQIYAITFGSGAGSTAQSTFRQCATNADTHYFHAPDAAQLKTVFQAIGRSLAQLSITS